VICVAARVSILPDIPYSEAIARIVRAVLGGADFEIGPTGFSFRFVEERASRAVREWFYNAHACFVEAVMSIKDAIGLIELLDYSSYIREKEVFYSVFVGFVPGTCKFVCSTELTYPYETVAGEKAFICDFYVYHGSRFPAKLWGFFPKAVEKVFAWKR